MYRFVYRPEAVPETEQDGHFQQLCTNASGSAAFEEAFGAWLRNRAAWVRGSDGAQTKMLVCHVLKGTGLGNMMQGLLSCFVVGLLTNRIVLVDWPRIDNFVFDAKDPEGTHSMPVWHDLFQLPRMQNTEPKSDDWKLWDYTSQSGEIQSDSQAVVTLDALNTAHCQRFACEDLSKIDAKWLHITNLFQYFVPSLYLTNPSYGPQLQAWFHGDAFRTIFCSLITPQLHHRAALVLPRGSDSDAPPPYIGLHLRTIAMNPGHAHHQPAQQRLVACAITVAKKKGYRHVYIAADSAGAKTRARKAVEAEGLVALAQEIRERAGKEGAGQSYGSRYAAFADMLVLAGAADLVVHERSTFSSTAYAVGGLYPYMNPPFGQECTQQRSREPCSHFYNKDYQLVCKSDLVQSLPGWLTTERHHQEQCNPATRSRVARERENQEPRRK
jgi:hypothetical protein